MGGGGARLPFLDQGVGVVVMDGLEVLRFDPVPGNVVLRVRARGDVADQVLDEDRVVVGAFGDGFFIGALEEAVKLRAGAGLDQANEVLDPDGALEPDGVSDLAPLVVGAGGGDGL